MEVPYMQAYPDYKIAVIPLNDGTFDVQCMLNHTNIGISIEVCRSKHHAVEGAKQFPKYYEIAKSHGFRIANTDFRHNNGREVNLSYAMDLDMTTELFTEILYNRA